MDKDSSGAARKRNEPPKQQSQQPKLVRDKPEKILGVTKIQGELHFLVKYKNKARNIIFPQVLRIRCLFDPWIRDPRWVKNQDTGRIFESLETVFFGVKIL